jgi:hypothetical protein
LLISVRLDKFPGRKSWLSLWATTMPGVRCLKISPSCTRMFIVSALYSYFFLISPKICLMGMWPATSCRALESCLSLLSPWPEVQPQKAVGLHFRIASLRIATLNGVQFSLAKALQGLSKQMHLI